MDSKGVMQQALLQIRQLKAELAAAQQQAHEPIAIIGMGCRLPGGVNNPAQLWQLLATGQDAITVAPADRWGGNRPELPPGGFLQDVDQFDPHFFGISPREAQTLDPQQRVLLEVSWEALEAAGVIPAADSATGIFAGIAENDYRLLLDRHPPAQQEHLLTGTSLDMAVGRLSYILGVTGPSVAINTACSSSLVAVHQACASLRQGECDLALAGGVSLMLVPEGTLALNGTGALAPDGRCKTFAATADGFARGEGCGMLVLKRLREAQRDGDQIAAVIRSSSVNHDGRSSTLVAPRGVAQQQLIEQALQSARMTPDDMDYIEAHGTGTALGDPIELDALGMVFRKREKPLAIGSLKTNIGHLEAAAGIAGLIKVVLMLQQQAIPPHLHCATPTPQVDWESLPLRVITELQDWSGTRAGVSSFGMSGTNAHVIVEQAPPVVAVSEEFVRPVQLLTLSAPDQQALAELVQRYQAAPVPESLADVCYTANTGRATFAYRLALTAESWPQMQAALAACDVQQAGYVPGHQAAPKIACLFTGQGAQSVGMGQVLYQTQPTFRAALAHCEALLAPYLSVSLLSVLYPAEPSEQLHQTVYTQPALFALEYALYQLWSAWGIKPEVLLGHSVGELVAACVAGVFSLEDGLKLIAARGRLMQALPAEGAMVALMCDEAQAQAALADDADTVAIAAVNGPRSVVISGQAMAVHRIVVQLNTAGVRAKPLQVSQAFHSPLMEPMLAEFRQVAASITYHAPQIPLISNVTGQLADETISTPDYWVRHVRAAVRFADGVQTAYTQGVTCLLEVGPKPVLLGLARLADGPEDASYLPSLRAGRDDWQIMLHSLAQLYMQGVAIDWVAFDQDYQRRKVLLPTYPFQRKRYWIAVDQHQPRQQLGPLVDRMLRLPQQQQVVAETEWSLARLPMLSEHQVAGRWVSPGACQLAMVLETALQAYPQRAWQLTDVVLPQALMLADDADWRTVQVALQTQAENGALGFDLVSFPPEQTAAEVCTHVSGSLVPVVSDRLAVDVSAWQAECVTPVDVAQLTAALQTQQIQLGPQFCWLAEVWSGPESVLGRLYLPAAVGSLSDYALHPGLLDACLQLTAVWQLADPDARADTLLPFAMGALKLLQPTGGTAWWACAHRLDAQHWDIRLCDTQGILLVQIDRFSVRALPTPAVSDQPAWQDWLYDITWQQQPRFGCQPDYLPTITEFRTALAAHSEQTWHTAAVQHALAHLPAQQGVRILEVGAGTGGITAGVLPLLPAAQTMYVYTDPDSDLLAAARDRFADYPFVRYQPLDIEQVSAIEDLVLQQSDMVIAADMSRMTCDLNTILNHVRQLLQPGGLLILPESSQARPTEDWQRALSGCGFTDHCVVTTQGDGQRVILARADTIDGCPVVRRTWLLLAGTDGLGDVLAAVLSQRGEQVMLVRAGEVWQPLAQSDKTAGRVQVGQICSDQPEDYDRLLADCPTPDVVVNLWGLDTPEVSDTTVLARELQVLCTATLHLVQALLRANLAQTTLWLISREAQAVLPDDRVPGLIQSTLWGLGRTIELEHPELQCTCLDMPQMPARSSARQAQAAALATELSAGMRVQVVGVDAELPERQLALRRGRRYAARLQTYAAAATGLPIPAGPFRLDSQAYGDLSQLYFASVAGRELAADEVLIRVQATGLNFRDVLIALNAYPDQGAAMGNECAGDIVAVGAAVTQLAVGDAVMALANHSFSDHVVARQACTIAKPDALSYTQAAALPIVFLTAYYALHHLAQMQPGERVLIHAASGGVGQAAVQLAQAAGVEVFATASRAKWDLLYEQGVTHVYDSRTLDFAAQIRADTQGAGVHMVLNSLTSAGFIAQSLSVLAPHGRFLEIAKRDVWTPEQMTAQRPDIAYHLLDLGDPMQQTPELIHHWLETIVQHYAAGILRPLPCTAFPLPRVTEAFRYMQQAQHVGKVVLTQARSPDWTIRPDRTYLLTGGLGGLGLEVAAWFIAQGARHLLLLGRSQPGAAAAQQIAAWAATGASIQVRQVDVSQYEPLAQVMTQIPADAPLAGVIHAAGTLEDKALLQQDWAAFAKVFAPKVWGAWHLHQLTAAQALDFFVVFSSITGLLGHAGQANHAAANVFLDGLMHYRRARQLPGLSIAWGAWSEVGVAAQLAHQHQSSMQARGEGVIDPQQGIQSFAYLLQQHSTHVGVMPTDWNRFLLTPPAQTAFFADFARQFASSEPAAAITIQASLRQQLIQATEPEQRRRILMDYLQETVGRVLAWNKPGLLDEQAGLMDVGMDSLMAVELRNILGRAIEQQLPATLLFTYPTLAALADYLLQQVIASGGDQVAAADSLDELSPDALADILATELR